MHSTAAAQRARRGMAQVPVTLDRASAWPSGPHLSGCRFGRLAIGHTEQQPAPRPGCRGRADPMQRQSRSTLPAQMQMQSIVQVRFPLRLVLFLNSVLDHFRSPRIKQQLIVRFSLLSHKSLGATSYLVLLIAPIRIKMTWKDP